ncbi:MAG: hypothetical protein ACFCUJ_13145 [Thiotrichales bacterium]
MQAPPDHELAARLNALRGQRLRVEQSWVIVVEVLVNDALVVLQEIGGHHTVQVDQFGLAKRRAPRFWTVPFRSEVDHDALHPTLEACLAAGLTPGN